MPPPAKDIKDLDGVDSLPAINNEYVSKNDSKLVKIDHQREPEFIRDVLRYFEPLVLLIFSYIAFWTTGNMISGAWLIYIGTPIYNYFMLYDSHNIDRKNEKAFMNSTMFYWPMYAYEFAQTVSWIYCMALFSTEWQSDHWMFQSKPETYLGYMMFCFVIGFFGALSSLAGHELVHHKSWVHKLGGNIPYIQFCYSHFWDEHTKGHHKYIATPSDPVCHDLGTNLYSGILKAAVGTHTSSWSREVKRLEKLHGGEISLFTNLTQNRMVYYQIFHAAMFTVIHHFFGWGGVKFQAMYTFQGIFWLEMVNYLEHYGLRRNQDENGITESVGYMHSWSSVSSPVSFRIQRHSDHHAHVFRPYQILRRFDRAPHLPYEYILMLYLAFFPPIYMMIMDPRVKSIRDAQAGIKNDDAWNERMPLSKADKERHFYCNCFFVVASVVFTGLLFV